MQDLTQKSIAGPVQNQGEILKTENFLDLMFNALLIDDLGLYRAVLPC